MKFTKIKPTKGQFIAVWEYNNAIWSDTFRFNSVTGDIMMFDNDVDEFTYDYSEPWNHYECKYVIMAGGK